MNDVIDNQDLFERFFLAEATKTRLGSMSSEHLRLLIKKFHSNWKFQAYSTPKIWTPPDKDKPLIVMGSKVAINADFRKPRLGICMLPDINSEQSGSTLHIWTDIENPIDYISANNAKSFRNEWLDWRVNSKKDTFVRSKFQLIDAAGKVNIQLDKKNSQIHKFICSIAQCSSVNKKLFIAKRELFKQQGLNGNVLTPFTFAILRG